MKIGFDLRFVQNELYSRFVIQLVKAYIKENKENEYIIYSNEFIPGFEEKNITNKNIHIKNGSFSEQIDFLKILKKDDNNLMVFFNHFKPINYKGQYITLVGGLKDIYYMNFYSYFEKYKYLFLMGKNLKKSNKIICLDQNTKNELIEKFDIVESNIEMINGFFPDSEEIEDKILDNDETIGKINIKTKYSIQNDFFIYSGGDSIEKNYEKLISVITRLNNSGHIVDLVFLGNNISSNINLRNLILENKIEKNIYFLGDVGLTHKKHLYNECLGVIFPSFYEPFPFRLTEPLFFNTQILTSDLKNIRNIFEENVTYFSPISVNSIYENTKKYLEEKNNEKKVNYKNIKIKYTKENSVKQLNQIIG
ncbi:MAG: glycosyltransferase [Candidatus Gracilibacteria bacterium]|nr:glycosyltransferase [Candidatus Gracilibacteria bacterium]